MFERHHVFSNDIKRFDYITKMFNMKLLGTTGIMYDLLFNYDRNLYASVDI